MVIKQPKRGHVVMMSGIQASGKSTKAKTYDRPIVGFDIVRKELGMKYGDNEGLVLQEVKKRCKELMAKKQDFVFDATNLVKQNRAKWIRLFDQYNYTVKIHYVERNFATIFEANRKRHDAVPDNVILSAINRLEFPTIIEAHEIEYSVGN